MDVPFKLGDKAESLRSTIYATEVAQNAPPVQEVAQPSTLMAGIELSTLTTAEAQPSGLWIPVDLPSMGLAGYPAQIGVRKFGLPDLARLGAARKANSYAMTVAAVGATIYGVDVKMLTHGDFDYIMYWHTTMSIVKAPLTVTWRSRYGYDNKTQVTKSMRKTVFIEDPAGVREMQAKGYDFSRVGDDLWRIHAKDLGLFDKTEAKALEELEQGNGNGLSGDELEVFYGLATWAKVSNPLDFESKLHAVRSMSDSLSFYEELDAWREVANHGVDDRAMLTCAHFKPEEAIGRISQQIALLDASLMSGGEFDENVRATSLSLLTELAELRKLEAAGKLSIALPKEEEIIIPLDVTNFFPVVL